VVEKNIVNKPFEVVGETISNVAICDIDLDFFLAKCLEQRNKQSNKTMMSRLSLKIIHKDKINT
jgi:hypothetical protein